MLTRSPRALATLIEPRTRSIPTSFARASLTRSIALVALARAS
jgi:hypothetical protein